MPTYSGYLIVGRCGLDDTPIRFMKNRSVAEGLAQRTTVRTIRRHAANVFGIGVSMFCNVSLVPFNKKGVPQPFILIKELGK
jgi:hypothetical protein